jgi:hypothetical protein
MLYSDISIVLHSNYKFYEEVIITRGCQKEKLWKEYECIYYTTATLFETPCLSALVYGYNQYYNSVYKDKHKAN